LALEHGPELEASLSKLCQSTVTIRERQVRDVLSWAGGHEDVLLTWLHWKLKKKRPGYFESLGGIRHCIDAGELEVAKAAKAAYEAQEQRPTSGPYALYVHQEDTRTEAEKAESARVGREEAATLEATLRARQMARQSGAMGDGLTPRSPEDVLAIMAVDQTRRPDGTMDTEAAEAALAKLAECASCKGHGVTDHGPCDCMAARWLVTARGKRLLAGYHDTSPAPVLEPVITFPAPPEALGRIGAAG
jgi:hypothetical protein